jgi:paraquat-inducible protein B
MVNQGVRVELETASFVTGQKDIALAKVPGAGKDTLTHEGNALVVPSEPGSLDNAIANLSDISTKLDKIPIDQIADNLNKLLVTTDKTVGGAQVKQTLAQLSATLRSANATLQSANGTLSSVNQDYGNDSDFQRNLEHLMDEATDALRSIKELSQYLDRHPQSLLLGRSGP